MDDHAETQRAAAAPAPDERSPLERLASFRFAYLAIFAFLLAYVFTVEGLERVLLDHFTAATVEAVRVDPADGSVPEQIHDRVGERIAASRWVTWGDVRVRPLVLAADGYSLIYAGPGLIPPLPDRSDLGESLLPAFVDVEVSVPHNGLLANAVLIFYAALLVSTLVIYTRRLAASEQAELDELSARRVALSERAQSIEGELRDVRERLAEIEPEHELYAEEVDALATEREQLLARLTRVEVREAELRERTQGAQELAEERAALESLLEEATDDLSAKEAEIADLRGQVKRTAGRGKQQREQDVLERRFRILYKDVEIDDRAVDDLAALGDESLKLRAEEAIKRIAEDSDQAVVRRKVGGIPPHLSIFELGFAGKGRIYYTKGQKRRLRVLAIGMKNSQKADLEYLSRLPKGT